METSPQVSRSDTEPLRGNQNSSTPVQCLNESQESQPEIQELTVDTTANRSGDDKIPASKFTASQAEETLVRDETANELFIALSSTIVLKRKKNCTSHWILKTT